MNLNAEEKQQHAIKYIKLFMTQRHGNTDEIRRKQKSPNQTSKTAEKKLNHNTQVCSIKPMYWLGGRVSYPLHADVDD